MSLVENKSLQELETLRNEYKVKLGRGADEIESGRRKDPVYEDRWLRWLDEYKTVEDRIRELQTLTTATARS